MEMRREGQGWRDGVPTGIVIRDRQEPQRRPAISAFIWGGKVAPTPALPFGRKAA